MVRAMKKIRQLLYFVLVLTFLSLILMCSDDNNPTEPINDAELVGKWKISKMSWSSSSESGTYSQTQLDSLGLIWQLTFYSDKTAEQMTNIDGPTITQECTWSTKDNVLTLTLKAPYSGSIDFKFTIAKNILTLDWGIPSGTEYIAEFMKQ